MTDRADEIARAYRQSYLLNVTLAVAAKTDGPLRAAVDAAEKQFAAALRSYGNERLEEAAALCGTPEERDEEFMAKRGEEEAWADQRDAGRADAARLVRSIKSQRE